ncbi:nuclear transport factor 2 family protein [Rhodococcus erythropolis]|uniref:nuclear transport factor 2 family protein n=1 Tax=Rhodococcus erythropolis TaxID=1833 RepID=UPI003872CD87|nr:hypothetical protein [Rhodococcus erythropolis]
MSSQSHLEARVHQIEARTEINELLGRYCTLVDQFRWEQWADCFTEDATYDMIGTPLGVMVGRTTILETCRDQNDGRWESTWHYMVPRTLSIVGDTANGSGWRMYAAVPKGGTPTDAYIAGGYHDYAFRRTSEGWKISALGGKYLWENKPRSW